MSPVSLSVGVGGRIGENWGFLRGPGICSGNDSFASDQLNICTQVSNGGWWMGMKGYKIQGGRRLRIIAKVKKGKRHDYPWPDDINPESKTELLKYLSYFKPLPEQPKPVTLSFEKPLVDLEKQIIEVRRMADETGLDFSSQILSLEKKYQQALKDLYTRLTPIQRLTIARHPNRPTVLDHILNITGKWVELHGDRAGYDDPAIVTGIGSINGKSYLFIGHQKGRNTKENIARNFAMPTPHGYRKALRMMKYADHHSFPIVTLIDTPGAFADLKSEELGQGEAIAHNLRTMFGLKVPIVTVVTGEGGSGGALAIGCANKLFMLENSAFYVASPEACAAILWKSSQAAPKAAEKLRITAEEHYKLKIADGIIPEPLGGAHADPAWTSEQIKLTIIRAMEELEKMNAEELLHHRMLKFRSIGGFKEGVPVDPVRKRNMKASDIDNSVKFSNIESEIKSLKRKILESERSSDAITNKGIEKLQKDVDQEITNALITMGLQEQLKSLTMELSKVTASNQPLNSRLKEKVDWLVEEFYRRSSRPGAYMSLKQKLQMLEMVNQLLEQKAKGEKLKTELNQKIQGKLKEKLEVLKKMDGKLEEGQQLESNLVTELERMKDEVKAVLKSANLEIVGVNKRSTATAVKLEETIAMKAKEEITKEIERAVNRRGLRSKLEKLKEEITKGSDPEKIKKMEAEIKDGIFAAMDVSMLNKKFENLRMELASETETPAGDNMGANVSHG